jgi:hypothetical protein
MPLYTIILTAVIFFFFSVVPVHSLVIPIPLSCTVFGNCTSTLNAAISTCAGVPFCTILLSAGEYALEGKTFSTLMSINGAENLAIVGAGDSTVLIANDIGTFFAINGGSNISLSSFAVDMKRQPYTYGVVTASTATANGTASTITFDINDYPINVTQYGWLETAQGLMGWDPILRHPSVDNLDIYGTFSVSFPPAAPGTLVVVAPYLPLNEHVILRHQIYAFNFVSAGLVSGISFTNVTLWSTAGMGFFTSRCSNVSLTGTRVVRKDSRPMSITADGAHIQDTQGGPVTFRGCVFEGQGDDGINVPTTFQDIVSYDSVTNNAFQVGGRNAPILRPLFGAKDTVNFYNRSSMAFLGSAIVASVDDNNTVHLSADSIVPIGVGLYTLVLSPRNFADYVEITDCIFRFNRARGALVKTSNAYIARNLFQGVSMSGIKTETDGCYWFEGRPVTNWTAINNTFDSCNYWGRESNGLGDISIDNSVPVDDAAGVPTTKCVHFMDSSMSEVQHNLTISDNIFISAFNQSAMTIWSVRGLNITSNIVTTVSGAPRVSVPIIGYGVVDSRSANNICDGIPCKTQGV